MRSLNRLRHILSIYIFYEMHIFKYSKRKGTRAAVMPDQIDEQVKAARSEKLIALGHDMSKEFRKFYIGKNEEHFLRKRP